MKAAINGIRYDTAVARTIGTFDNLGKGAQSVEDQHYWNATLYVTPIAGHYFLHGMGGRMTRFCWVNDDRGERILPLSRDEAYEWAQRYLGHKTVERFFPDLIEKG